MEIKISRLQQFMVKKGRSYKQVWLALENWLQMAIDRLEDQKQQVKAMINN